MHLSHDTFTFLREIDKNNDRTWFLDHKHLYLEARQDLANFVGGLIRGLSAFDPKIHTQIPVDSCLFRIYKDVRFSKDKSPYKTWLGAGISLNGRKLEGPEYYIHIQPDKSFIAAGYWRPAKEHLAAIRQEIDYNPAEFAQIIGTLADSTHPLQLDQDDKLVRPPKGYSDDNITIEWLKLKSFTLSKAFTDQELCNAGSLERVLEQYERMYPFKNFLENAIDM